MRLTRSNMIVAVFALLFANGECARILGLFPHVGKSHYMVFQPLMLKLAERGHQVTTVSFFPLENQPANFTDVPLGSTNMGIEAMDINLFENRSPLLKIPVVNTLLKSLVEVNRLRDLGLSICEMILGQKSLSEALTQEYDVVLIENFNSDCMLGLLHVYGNRAPIIGLSSCVMMPWTSDRFGLPDNPAYIPLITTPFTENMSFRQRFENTMVNVYLKYWYRELQEKERSMIERYYGVRVPDLAELAKQTQLLLVNTFNNLNGVRPVLPSTVEVGGMHLERTRKPVSPYIERFLNESEHGVILLSFGSLIKTATIPKYKEEIIVNTLAKFKQRVIWKYEDSGEEGTLTGNILRVKWLPQYELLQHKKVVAFIAHGGLLGMTEAVSAGKPMVVVPFFGDQPANGAAAEAVGFAKVVPYIELTEKALTEALEFVLSAQTRLNARRVSSIWRDRQADPLDTAVYWTERVIRWGHNAPLHSAARDMPLYQLALIDVIAAFVVAILIILALSWFTLSMVFRLLFTKESKLKMH